MQKRYKALSFLSFSVTMGKESVNDNGRIYERDVTKRIVFEPESSGLAYYATSESSVQAALEKHPFYKKLFVPIDEPKVKENKPVEAKPKGKVKVEVSSAADAKQYLVEKFEISRTQIQTTKDIKKFAELNGVEFVGI